MHTEKTMEKKRKTEIAGQGRSGGRTGTIDGAPSHTGRIREINEDDTKRPQCTFPSEQTVS
jgi:hypothetical protein